MIICLGFKPLKRKEVKQYRPERFDDDYSDYQKGGGSMTTKGTIDKEHVRRVRRRIEDTLRKSDADTILSVAKFLGVSTEVKIIKEDTHNEDTHNGS